MKFKIIIIFLALIVIFSLIFGGFKTYQYMKVKYAKIEIVLNEDLTLEFNDNKRISDYIYSINGKILNDEIIDSTKLGKKEITFSFINDDNIKLNYSFNIEVVDTVPPIIWLSDTYNIPVNSNDYLLDKILCGDNYDDNPKCEIIGEYDLNTLGVYPLTFKAIDNSNNETLKEFHLNVYEPTYNQNKETVYQDFNEIVEQYKGENTSIGIDVSKWQGDIDFEKLKEAHVEFIIIKVGGNTGIEGEYYVDSKFERNIKLANQYDIPVGLYFYSYSKNSEEAINDAKWLINEIKDYKIDLPIAFDWEDFSDYNSYHMSFYNLTKMADSFLNTIESAGYDGMLYSSKNYLENIWMPVDHDIWLAHYIDQTTYQGKYKFWQLCDNGRVDGINAFVDIDIMYHN